MRPHTLIGVCTAISLLAQCGLPAATVYVNPAAPGPAHDGQSWSTAYPTIQAGLADALAGDEVWVAAGTYRELVLVPANVGLYGGFAGVEADKTQRDWHVNRTTLDGEGAGCVVTVRRYGSPSTCIDGFTICGGAGELGGGIRCRGTIDARSDLTVANCVITGNTATAGAGIHVEYSALTVRNTELSGNTASGIGGGAIHRPDMLDAPWFPAWLEVTDCVISNNTAVRGGGICSGRDAVRLLRNEITDNRAWGVGAGGGGVAILNSGHSEIRRNTFLRNSCTDLGGAIWWRDDHGEVGWPVVADNLIANNTAGGIPGLYTTDVRIRILNNTFVGNIEQGQRGTIESNGKVIVANNIVAHNSSGLRSWIWRYPSTYNCVYGNTNYNYDGCDPGEGDIAVDPLLRDIAAGDFRLGTNSPCIDNGDDSWRNSLWPDLGGNHRIRGARVDIGAHEFGLGRRVIMPRHGRWRYARGTTEASTPSTAWRSVGFDDITWAQDPAPFGYAPAGHAEHPFGTELADMQNGYTSLFLRERFEVFDVVALTNLVLSVDYDDAYVVWLNGVEVKRANVSDPLAHDGTADGEHEAGTRETHLLPAPYPYLWQGTNIIAVQAFNLATDSDDFKIEVGLASAEWPCAPRPVIVPAGGVFANQVAVSITTAGGATVYYTTDGSAPDTNAFLYTAPFTLTSSTPVKAQAYLADLDPSPVNAVDFTVIHGAPGPAAPSGLAAGEVNFSSVLLHWNDESPDEDGFILERKVGASASWTYSVTLGSNVVAYADAAVVEGETYDYRLKAFNQLGESAYVNAAPITVPARMRPFTAYNDLAWYPGQLSNNITRYTSGEAGPLIDYPTGVPRQALLSVAGGAIDHPAYETQGANAAAGTDADAFFGGIVDCRSVISYGGDPITLEFGALERTLRYTITLFSNRDNSYTPSRQTRMTLSGAAAFTNASSAGALVATTTQTGDTTLVGSDNTGSGHVACFAGVDPGADGEVAITIDSPDGHQYINAVLLNGEAPAYLTHIRNREDVQVLSVPSGWRADVRRALLYLAPARADAELLPVLFQNANLYALHVDFLRELFPERFPGLTMSEYSAMTRYRATRSYYGGAVYEFWDPAIGVFYGFDVMIDWSLPTEALGPAEIQALYAFLQEKFDPIPLYYAPTDSAEIENARGWSSPPFPVYLPEGLASPDYEPYTEAENYGRVRCLTATALQQVLTDMTLSWQDIVVLEQTPADLETIVAGVITAQRQTDLSHINVRCARRGTPNAFVADATNVFSGYEGQLVRLAIGTTNYTVSLETNPAVAQAWWDAHRPTLSKPPPLPDWTCTNLLGLSEAPTNALVSELMLKYGGKTANLMVGSRYMAAPYRVQGFGIPFLYYKEFMEFNELIDPYFEPGTEKSYAEYIARLCQDPAFNSDAALRDQLLDDFRDTIRDNGVVPPGQVDRLIQRIYDVFGSYDVRVRFRSSSNLEDDLEFSAAGLHDSTTVIAQHSISGGDRTIERGLKKVWKSLWNFRAYEERQYYQIDQRQAAMAILVSTAFPDELANGVAFTGDPTGTSPDYLINVNPYEYEVVHPEPGTLPEKDVLEITDGVVTRITRLNGSTYLPAGMWVLSDARLQELGGVMAGIDVQFPLELQGYKREDVLLDMEFKLDNMHQLRIKQIRPYLKPSAVAPLRVAFETPLSVADEAAGSVDIPVQLTRPAETVVTVDYGVTGGSAADGADFILPAGTLTFAIGESGESIRLTVLNDDELEPPETVELTLSAPAGAVPGAERTHTVRLVDNDGAFTAYNDLAWFAGQLGDRITSYTTTNGNPGGVDHGYLVDHLTGRRTDVLLTITGGGAPHPAQGADPGSGTDAYDVFAGHIDCLGTLTYSDTDLVLQLSGLNPLHRYEMVLYSDRANAAYTGPDARWHYGTLEGAAGFGNESTPATTILTSATPNDTTLYNAGENNGNGCVTRFTDVEPGPDGVISIRLRRDSGSSYYTYANALMLKGTVPEPPPLPAAPSALAAVGVSSSRIDLSWQDNSGDEDGFLIDRRQSGTPDWTIDHTKTAADVTAFSDTGLPPETKFYYRVRAYNITGDSPVSSVAYAVTKSWTPLLYVDVNAPGPVHDGLSWATAFLTIQAAVNVAEDSNVVVVADGVYRGAGNRAVDFLGKSITVRSQNGPENTRVDCENSDRGFIFQTGETTNAVLAGLTIEHGAAPFGGAILVSNASPTIVDCVLRDNTAVSGGGVHCVTAGTGAVIDRCTIVRNRATGTDWTRREGMGGAIYIGGGKVAIHHCMIIDNDADVGGGAVGGRRTEVRLQNCTLVGNTSPLRGSAICYDMEAQWACRPFIWNTIVWGHPGRPFAEHPWRDEKFYDVRYCCVQGGYGGERNTAADPGLVRYGDCLFVTGLSPCVDAGTTSEARPSDIHSEPWWDHPDRSNVVSTVDIGADEFLDSDGDGAADAWEHVTFGSLARGLSTDQDGDGLSDAAEFTVGADPRSVDTDGDGLDDGFEVLTLGSSPLLVDTDGDAMHDGWEVDHGLSPVSAADAADDGDADTYMNVYEFTHGTDPLQATSYPGPDIWVAPLMTGPGGDGSVTNPFATIQAALDAATDYQIICLRDGVYAGPENRDLAFDGKPVLLRSENGPMHCVIDCLALGRAMHFNSAEQAETAVCGVTIRNGYSAQDGGAVRCVLAGPTFQNCVIEGGAANRGGAAFFDRSAARLRNCVVVANTADTEGGGLYATGTPGPELLNCIVWANQPASVYGTNAAVRHSCVAGGHAGEGNIDADPAFTGGPQSYRLSAASPCIDAGTDAHASARDVDGDSRWDHPLHTNAGSVVDIGIDEFVDLDGDEMPDSWEAAYYGDTAAGPTDDTDGDGLDALAEYGHGSSPISDDTDADGLSDPVELQTTGTRVNVADTDGDGILDGWEHAHGLDPLAFEDGTHDPDADGYMNVYEYRGNSDMLDATSTPAPDMFVDAATSPGGDGSVAAPFQAIQDALDHAPAFAVIAVRGGVYRGARNRALDFRGKPLMLTAAADGGACEIDCEHQARGFTFQSDEDRRSVVRGLRILNGNAVNGGGILCDGGAPTISDCEISDCTAERGGGLYCDAAQGVVLADCRIIRNVATNAAGLECRGSDIRIERCIVAENKTTGGDGGAAMLAGGSRALVESSAFCANTAARGGAIYSTDVDVRLVNCTLTDNVATNGGNALFCGNANGRPSLTNCIVWGNPAPQISGGGSESTPLGVSFSCVEGGYAGDMNISNAPGLLGETVRWRLGAASPCIDRGAATAPLWDADRELRWDAPGSPNAVSIVDIGADEFADTDADDMADAWEAVYWGGLAPGADEDEDGDGLSNLREYEEGTVPTLADTDGDGLSDGSELLVHHTLCTVADSDGDHMWDGWEIAAGLDPLSASDPAMDRDADGHMNVYEFVHGSDPLDPGSVPVPDIFVDSQAGSTGDGSAGNPFATIQAALDVAAPYQIISLAAGVYSGDGNKNLDFPPGTPVAVMSAGGPSSCVIDCEGSGRAVHFRNGERDTTLLAGLTIRNGRLWQGGGAIYIQSCSPTIRNCAMHGNTAGSGGAIGCHNGKARILHCTILDNHAHSSGGGIYCSGTVVPEIRNCIVYGNVRGQIVGAALDVSHSCVQGGCDGPLNFDEEPGLVRAPGSSRLRADSACIDRGMTVDSGLPDGDGEQDWDHPGHGETGVLTDVGADEFVDTDDDGLADAWERAYFGGLSVGPASDTDGDNLPELAEYEFGCDPLDPDTDDDGLTDGEEVVGFGSVPSHPDGDGDMMPDHWEVAHGLSATNATDYAEDHDADGYVNLYEFLKGTDPSDPGSAPVPDVYVDAAAAPGGDGSAGQPFDTIQAALDAAQAHDVVRLMPGVYKGTGNKGLSFNGKSILVTSAGSPGGCVIDCEGEGTGFGFNGYEGRDAMLHGVTIRNGYANNGAGGLNIREAGPTISDCVIKENTGTLYPSGLPGERGGGGIRCFTTASPLIKDCLIERNVAQSRDDEDYATRGGGVYLTERSTTVIEGCTISGNTATHMRGPSLEATLGAGICCDELAVLTIRDCRIVGNRVWNTIDGIGAGIAVVESAEATIRGCVITDNVLEPDAVTGGLYGPWGGSGLGGGVFLRGGSRLEDCMIRRNRVLNDAVGDLARGGGVYSEGGGTIRNCKILDNRCAYGMGAGISCQGLTRVENCVIAGNDAESGTLGDGVYCEDADALFLHCTMAGNYGLQLAMVSGSVSLVNSIVWGLGQVDGGGVLVGTHSCCDQPLQGTGNIALPPDFVSSDDYSLQASSPCVDAGILTNASGADLVGCPRPLDGDNDGIALPDVGAYELARSGADTDGDGWPDALELARGTDPTDPGDPFEGASVFVAYNDLSWADGQLAAKITQITTDSGAAATNTGLLVNYFSGAETAIRLTVTGGAWNGAGHASLGTNARAGTDAARVFEGIVDCEGVISYGTESVELAFSGLDPRQRYELVLFGNRAEPAYEDRVSDFVLKGALAFMNASTLGVSVLSNSVPNDTARMVVGDNTAWGCVARFSAIEPGADGAVRVEVGGNRPYVNALMLRAVQGELAMRTDIPKGAAWRMRKGTAEGSTPVDAWRQPDFDDALWAPRNAPIGYAEPGGHEFPFGTELTDMQGAYTTVYLRREFWSLDAAATAKLTVYADYDDGFIVWINGQQMLAQNEPAAAPTFDSVASAGHESGSYETFVLPDAPSFLRTGRNLMAVQVFNVSLSSSDFKFDLELPTPTLRAFAPTASPEPGTYTNAIDVTLSAATTGASIFYTTDGNTPDTNAILYENPIPVTNSTTVKAIAWRAGYEPSAVLTVQYDIEYPIPPIPIPTVEFAQNSVTSSEELGEPVIEIALSHAFDKEVALSLYIADTTMDPGFDYELGSKSVVFAPGETRRPIAFFVKDDARLELDESIEFKFSIVTNALPGSTMSCRCVVRDNEGALPGAFSAYNDLAWFDGQAQAGITTYTTTNGFPDAVAAGMLVDRLSGVATDVKLTVTGGLGVYSHQGAHPASGTDAHAVFDGVVDCAGTVSYGAEDLVLRFEGLRPELRYDLALYCDRNEQTYTGASARVHRGTLVGADSFVNISSEGVQLVTDSTADDTTSCNAGYNNEAGYVTRFAEIDPGADGEVLLRLRQDRASGLYSYANALRLRGYAPTPAGAVLVDRSSGNTGAADGSSWAKAFLTIQAGLDAAAPGDTVVVADGIYSGAGNLNIDFGGKPVTLRSLNGPRRTVVDCAGQGRGFVFTSAEGTDSVLAGITVRNGVAEAGAGIYCDSAGPTIASCIVSGNVVRVEAGNALGGGIACVGSASPVLEHVLVCANRLESGVWGAGAGIACIGTSDTIIRHCQIVANELFRLTADCEAFGVGIYTTARSTIEDCDIALNVLHGWFDAEPAGGGIYCEGVTTIRGCRVIRNCAADGIGSGIGCRDTATIEDCVVGWNYTTSDRFRDGIACDHATVTIRNCSILGNTMGGGVTGWDSSITLQNSIVWHNRYRPADDIWLMGGELRMDYCCLGLESLAITGVGNITNLPNFVDVKWDWRLLPDSPCIDSGDAGTAASSDVFGTARPLDGDDDGVAAPDMGAYEHVHPSSDTDGDGYSDADEIAAGTSPVDPADNPGGTLPPGTPFTAYNDLCWASGQVAANIARYSTGDAGLLVDYETGSPLPVTLTVAGGNPYVLGANAAAGTDADEVFGGVVDCTGVIGYSAENLTLRFAGLATNLVYELVLFGNRDNPGYIDRLSTLALSGVDAFRNESSVGTDFAGPADASTVVCNGWNTDNGYVVRFVGIEPGADGELLVTVSDATSKFYANAVMLKGTLPAPPEPPVAPSALAAVGVSSSGIDLSWQDNSDEEDGFLVDRRRSGTVDWTPGYAATAADITTFSDTGLPAETKFYYRARAYNAAGSSALSALAYAWTQAEPVPGGFTAYNDLCWATGQASANITRYSTGDSGSLTDHQTGAALPVTLEVAGGNPYVLGADAAAGTDADEVFGGIVDCTGVIGYSTENLTLRFTGLTTDLAYTVVLFGNRDNSGYTDRLSTVTISGADAFRNESSTGTGFSGATAASTVVCNGWNRDNGYVVRFRDIEPGTDGALLVTVSDAASRFYANAVMLRGYVPQQAEVAEVRVNSSTRDVEENAATGAMYNNSSDIEMVMDASRKQIVGLRFGPLAVPQGATIRAAYVQFVADESHADPTDLLIEGEAVDNSVTFVQEQVSTRARTSANVGWSPPAWVIDQAGSAQRTPDLSTIVQEIVSRPGWQSGNALALIVTGSGRRCAISYDKDPAQAALLHVEYGGGAASAAAAPAADPPPVFAAGGDANGSGLDDAWEFRYFDAGIADPDGDPDGDGVSNQDEYICGSDPGDGTGYLRLETGLQSGQLQVRFAALAAEGAAYEGRTRCYALEACSDLAAGDWLVVPGYARIVGTGTDLAYQPSGDAPMFFRLRVWLE